METKVKAYTFGSQCMMEFPFICKCGLDSKQESEGWVKYVQRLLASATMGKKRKHKAKNLRERERDRE